MTKATAKLVTLNCNHPRKRVQLMSDEMAQVIEMGTCYCNGCRDTVAVVGWPQTVRAFADSRISLGIFTSEPISDEASPKAAATNPASSARSKSAAKSSASASAAADQPLSVEAHNAKRVGNHMTQAEKDAKWRLFCEARDELAACEGVVGPAWFAALAKLREASTVAH